MIVKSLEFKNINSYGNKLQRIEFREDGNLILLRGENGHGKSTIKQVLEFAPYDKVQGISGKKLSKKKLANRINNDLYVSIDFINNLNKEVRITRNVNPDKVTVIFDGIDITEQYSAMDEYRKDNITGISYDIFKSFVSINMNSFMNFISLSDKEKDATINKIFNLDVLSDFSKITSHFTTSLNTECKNLEFKIKEKDKTIQSYRDTINSITDSADIETKKRIEEIKSVMLDIKPRYTETENSISDLKSKIDEITVDYDKESHSSVTKKELLLNIGADIRNIDSKITLHKEGKCPHCNTELSEESDTNISLNNERSTLFNDYSQNKAEYELIINKMNLHTSELKELKIKLKNDEILLNDFNNEISLLKSEYSKLIASIKISNAEIEINNKIDVINEELIKLKSEYINKKHDYDMYSELSIIFNDDVIRKDMVKNIIKPLNDNLNYFLKEINSPYHAKINDDFGVSIFERRINEIDPETLSKGEDKKINLAIALSYIKTSLDKKMSNILFLDEVFDSMSVINIDLLLDILKKLAKETSTNIIAVHHDGVNRDSFFDIVITATKDVFSDISIKYNNQ